MSSIEKTKFHVGCENNLNQLVSLHQLFLHYLPDIYACLHMQKRIHFKRV